MNYWLLKTEPEAYSWVDFVNEGKTVWNGVKAGNALKNMARMLPGDKTFIYHTGKERAIIGTAEVISMAYPDPYENNPRLLVIEIVPLIKLNTPVSLKKLKDLAEGEKDKVIRIWKDWDLLRLPRLSVVEVNEVQWKEVLKLGKEIT